MDKKEPKKETGQMVKIKGHIEKIAIGQKKDGDQSIVALTVTLIVPVWKSETVNDVYSVFQEQSDITFEPAQQSLEFEPVTKAEAVE